MAATDRNQTFHIFSGSPCSKCCIAERIQKCKCVVQLGLISGSVFPVSSIIPNSICLTRFPHVSV